jgi:hypothetical protein
MLAGPGDPGVFDGSVQRVYAYNSLQHHIVTLFIAAISMQNVGSYVQHLTVYAPIA